MQDGDSITFGYVSIRLHVGVARQGRQPAPALVRQRGFNPSSRRSSPSGSPASRRASEPTKVSIRLHVGVARQENPGAEILRVDHVSIRLHVGVARQGWRKKMVRTGRWVSIRLHVGVARQELPSPRSGLRSRGFNPSSRRSSPSGRPGREGAGQLTLVSIRLHVGVARQARYVDIDRSRYSFQSVFTSE